VATPELILLHPNREKPAAQATRLAVVVLLLASAALMVLVAAGGWSALHGQRGGLIAYIVVYVVLAFFTARWKRGVLPVAATLAIILAIFAAVGAPGWFARQGDGFADPGLGNGLLGLITALLIPLQALVIFFAARGFAQDWHVEVERGPTQG
jgi:prepilin signal peptidase PulO-like enzyme (type II secretory pathway)